MSNYVPGQGNANAKIMFIGEAPGADEDQSGIPFTGPSGNILWEICRELGLYRGDVYTTNVVKYRPPQNDLARLKEIEVDFDGQVSQLWDEIAAINPNIIVTLGKTSTKVVTGKDGILKWRGSCIKSAALDYKVIPTIHPAALLHAEKTWGRPDAENEDKNQKGALKFSYRHIIKLDIAKAIQESHTREYTPPNRVVEIARDSVTLQRFLDVYRDKDLVSVDIEVEKAIPFCIALAFNEWHAISIPLVDIWGIFKSEEGVADHQLAEMWMMVDELFSPTMKVIGQNFKFDQGQLLQCCGIQIRNFHCDTSLLAACVHPEFPKALDFNTSIYTNVPYYKDEGKTFNWKKSPIRQILHYNGLDACVTFEIYTEMMKEAREMVIPGFPNWVDEFCLDYQRELHHFYFDMERVGFKTDADRQKVLIAQNKIQIEKDQAELTELCGFPLNVQSPKQVSMLLYDEFQLPWRKGASEDVLVALMANTKKLSDKHKRTIELILTLRRHKLTGTKYFGAKVDFDGRMKTSYTIAGTETGRSSTKILKPPVRPIKMGIPFQTMTKHGDIGVEIREMFIADEGYCIVETDMSQAEARIVALLANDSKLLSLFASKADVHTLTTSWIFGIERQLVTKELRFIGKTTRHAGNYGMKKRRLAEIVNTDSKKFKIEISNFSEFRAGQVLDKFHAYSPNIRGVFHQGVIEALTDNKRVLVNPYGRQRQFFDRWGEELFKEAFAQIPQSTVPDHVRHAGIASKKLFKKESIDARFILEGHDSLIGLVREKDVDAYVEIVHQQIEVPIDFSRCTMKRGLLVIPAESKVGYNYRDASKSNPNGLKDYKRNVQIAV